MKICTVSLPLLMLLVACGGGSTNLPSAVVTGAYEFLVTSNVTGGVTLVEANLASNGNKSEASGPSEVQVLTLEQKNWYLNGVCPGGAPGENSVATSLNSNNVGITFNVGGNEFVAQGVVAGTTISGNYSISGSKCQNLVGNVGFPSGFDSGGFTANPVPALAGTFSGTLNLQAGSENAALTLSEGKDHTLTVNAALKGVAFNGTVVLSGYAVGNVMFVSGSLNGGTLHLFGYLDRTGSFTGTAKSLLVFDYSTLAELGLLLGS